MKISISDDVILKTGERVKVVQKYGEKRYLGEMFVSEKGWMTVNFDVDDVDTIAWEMQYEE